MRRALRVLIVMLAAMSLPTAAAGAASGDGGGAAAFPTTIPLPDGFAPEGIAIGAAPFAYFGSLLDGSIYRADLVTGRGGIISEGPGTASAGMKLDHRGRLFVAGADAGNARIVSASTGDVLASYTLTTLPTFVNDVILTPDAAWFTDSFNPVVYKLPLDRSGRLPSQDQVVTVPLTGDIVIGEGFNINGISRTPDGSALLAVQTNTGLLLRIDPATGATTTVDLGGELVSGGDGILLCGRTLYVVENVPNEVAVVRLDRTGAAGSVVDRLTDPRFDVPTTAARFDGRVYVVNSRFLLDPTPTTTYTAVAIPTAGP
jgi:sugar lactone lactonase YvrE